jgi:hypothetical protein
MSKDIIVVKGYADLISDPKLRGDEPDVVAREIQEHGGDDDYLVAWVQDWIFDEKEIEPVGHSNHIISGRVDAEAEKAYLLVDGRVEAWLPKSVIRVFRVAGDVDFEIPQSGLGDFARGGESDA